MEVFCMKGIVAVLFLLVAAVPAAAAPDLRYSITLTSPYDSTDSFFNRVDLLIGCSYGLMGEELPE